MVNRIKILSYTLEVKPPLHIGTGVKRGVLNESMLGIVPGNTLRGLIGHSLLKLTCLNPKTLCNICKEAHACVYHRLICSLKLGEGAYFHPGYYLQNVEKKHIKGIQLRRTTKTVVEEASPFIYEVLYPIKDDKIKISSKIIIKDSDEDVNALKKAVKASIGMGLGGRRSWSWGSVISTEIKGVETVELESHSRIDANKLELKVKTPLPITKAAIADSIRQGINDLLASFYAQNLPAKNTFKIELKDFALKPITSWTECENKPRKVYLALETNTQFKLMELNQEIATIISQITPIVGIAESGHWFTNAGYGLCEIVEDT